MAGQQPDPPKLPKAVEGLIVCWTLWAALVGFQLLVPGTSPASGHDNLHGVINAMNSMDPVLVVFGGIGLFVVTVYYLVTRAGNGTPPHGNDGKSTTPEE